MRLSEKLAEVFPKTYGRRFRKLERNATIEQCARVADSFLKYDEDGFVLPVSAPHIGLAIRTLKDPI